MALGRPGRLAHPAQLRTASKSDSSNTAAFAVAGLGILAALFFGFAIGSGNTILIVVLTAIFGGGLMLMMPGQALVAAMMVLCIFVIGIATYFLHVKQAIWIAYGLGFAFYLRSAVGSLSGANARNPPSLLVASLITLVLIVIGTTLINRVGVIQTIVGTKNILGLPGLFVFIAAGGLTIVQAETIYRYLLITPVIQIPFAAYQNFVIAPRRGDYASWDAVVGTMGGNPEGGGASGVLAVLMTTVGVLAFALYRNGKLSLPTVLGIIACCFAAVLLAETKVIVLFIPIAVLTYLAGAERLSLGRGLLGLVASAVLGLTVLFGYNQIHYVGTPHHSSTLSAMLEDAFGYSLDSGLVNMSSGEAGRTAIFEIWWNDVVVKDTPHALLGYGPGASRGDSDFAIGKLAQRYNFRIDRSTGAQLLWDIGILGVVAFFALLATALIMGLRLARNKQLDPERRLYVSVSASILALALATFPYSRDLLESPPLGALAMFALGYIGLVGAALPSKGRHLA